MDIPFQLRQARLSRGLTLEQLGQMVGRSRQYLNQVEKGKIRLSYELAVKIAAAMGTTPDAIFSHEDSYSEYKEQLSIKVIQIVKLRQKALLLAKELAVDGLTKDSMYLTSLINRSLHLADGITMLLKERNLTCAGAILRLLLDNCMRAHAYFIVSDGDLDALLESVLKPQTRFDKLRDIKNRHMRDNYLKDEVNNIDNEKRFSAVYNATSGYIHFSSKAFYNMTKIDESKRTFSFNVGGPLSVDWDTTLLECADTFIRYFSFNQMQITGDIYLLHKKDIRSSIKWP